MHFFAWSNGLKTGMYYLRTRPKANAIQFTVDQKALAATRAADKRAEETKKPTDAPAGSKVQAAVVKPAAIVKELKPQVVEDDGCLMCGS